MKARNIAAKVRAALEDTPVVFLQGPRQAGKSTFALSLIGKDYPASYVSLDDGAVLAAALADPDGFVAGLPRKTILDEVQRAPDLFRAIKASVDRDRSPGRFLLTGSAHAFLLPKVSESLAGRMEVLTLFPFSQGERTGVKECFVEHCFQSDFSPYSQNQGEPWEFLTDRIVAGGFPEAAERRAGQRREAWFDAYVTTLLERDIRDMANLHGFRELPRLIRLAATRSAGLLNLAGLSRDAAIPLTTLQRYWALLEAIFLISCLPSWSSNLGSRQVKAPKLFFTDTGLLCHLLGLNASRLRTDDLMNGSILENFVAQEVIRQTHWCDFRVNVYHYRTHTQQEVDLVLEDASGRLVGIEVKKSATPTARDFRGLHHLKSVAGTHFVRGIVLHGGSSSVSFAPDMHALPISSLWMTVLNNRNS